MENAPAKLSCVLYGAFAIEANQQIDECNIILSDRKHMAATYKNYVVQNNRGINTEIIVVHKEMQTPEISRMHVYKCMSTSHIVTTDETHPE